MTLVDCKKCNGTGYYSYETKTGPRVRICNRCSHGKIDIIYKTVIKNEKRD